MRGAKMTLKVENLTYDEIVNEAYLVIKNKVEF